MATKSERLEARVSPEQRARLEWAAQTAGLSLSTFVLDAAVDRAEEILATETTTLVPIDYFETLLANLDAPDQAPTLARSARRARDNRNLRRQ
jgi:uncharacterized protein (DUF1778 family)